MQERCTPGCRRRCKAAGMRRGIQNPAARTWTAKSPSLAALALEGLASLAEAATSSANGSAGRGRGSWSRRGQSVHGGKRPAEQAGGRRLLGAVGAAATDGVAAGAAAGRGRARRGPTPHGREAPRRQGAGRARNAPSIGKRRWRRAWGPRGAPQHSPKPPARLEGRPKSTSVINGEAGTVGRAGAGGEAGGCSGELLRGRVAGRRWEWQPQHR